jgi:hypothetical protein
MCPASSRCDGCAIAVVMLLYRRLCVQGGCYVNVLSDFIISDLIIFEFCGVSNKFEKLKFIKNLNTIQNIIRNFNTKIFFKKK